MRTPEIETRVAILEAEVDRLRAKVDAGGPPVTPWWERIVGSFADDPAHEQAMKLGRAYRESLRPGRPKVLKIAAIALANRAPLVTRNRADFENVSGLIVEDWTT